MGYPMSWQRVWLRNHLSHGLGLGYQAGHLQGDLLRFENDIRCPDQCVVYAREAGVDADIVRRVLDAVFKRDGLQEPLLNGAMPQGGDSRGGWPV